MWSEHIPFPNAPLALGAHFGGVQAIFPCCSHCTVYNESALPLSARKIAPDIPYRSLSIGDVHPSKYVCSCCRSVCIPRGRVKLIILGDRYEQVSILAKILEVTRQWAIWKAPRWPASYSSTFISLSHEWAEHIPFPNAPLALGAHLCGVQAIFPLLLPLYRLQ